MDWPKELVVRGVTFQVNNWDELEEAIRRFGSDQPVSVNPASEPRGPLRHGSRLSPSDRHMLERFLAEPERGMRNSDIASALGAASGEIGAKLNDWARRIGIATGDGSAFEGVNLGRAGRGHRLTTIGQGVARALLEGGG
jgi:hypothetical protein